MGAAFVFARVNLVNVFNLSHEGQANLWWRLAFGACHNAFWSITMYNAQSFFVANPINRYNIAAWMPLKYNADGSLDVYIQRDSPGKDKESNWLPAAEAEFSLTMRIYWPKESMLD
jgi:hypothetical protein